MEIAAVVPSPPPASATLKPVAPGWMRWLTPIRCRILLVLVLLFGFLSHLHYLTDNCPLDLSGDEAHYWDWSRQLGLSYYSKGPLVAYIIRASTSLFGDKMWAVRLPALVLAMGTGLVTYLLTLKLFKSDRIALGAVLLNGTVPMFVAGSLLMTIDPPFFFCWALATYLAALAIFDERKWVWPIIGVVVGLGFLAKYAMYLWIPILFLAIWMDGSSRKLLRSPWPYLMAVIALLFATPVVLFNAQHDWVSLKHVATQTGTDRVMGFGRGNFFELVFGQVAVLGGVALIMGGGVIYALVTQYEMARGMGRRVLDWEKLPQREKLRKSVRRRWEGYADEPRGREMTFLIWIGLPFLLLTVLTSFRSKVQMNWPAPAYFSLMVLGAYFLATRLRDRRAWKRWRGWLYGSIFFAILFMPLVHNTEIVYPLIRNAHAKLTKWGWMKWPINARKFDFSVRLKGWKEMGDRLSPELAALGPNAIAISDDYQRTGELAFYLDGQPKTYYAGSYFTRKAKRHCQYDLWPDRSLDPNENPALLGRNALFVGYINDDIRNAFERVEGPFEFDIVRRKIKVGTVRYSKCYGFKGLSRPAKTGTF